MSLSEELKKLNIPIIVSLVIGVFATLAPGSLITFFFNEELFRNLDLSKLLIISCALTLPGLLAPYVISIASETGGHYRQRSVAEIDHLSLLTIHGINAGLNIYANLLVCYFFNLQFKTFLAIYILLTFITIISELYHSTKRKRERDAANIDTLPTP